MTNKKKKIDYWLDLAKYDLKTADVMLNNKHFYMLVSCAIKLLKKH